MTTPLKSCALFVSPGVAANGDLQALRDELKAVGWPVAWQHRLGEDGPTLEAVSRACDEGIRRLIVSGGDGSVSRVVKAVTLRSEHARMEIGVIPGGTGNDFARSLGLDPADREAAIRQIGHGEPRPCDVAWAAGECFVNAVTVGLGAEITRDNPPVLKKVARGLSYSLTGTWKTFAADPFELDFQSDRFCWAGRALSLTVCNGAFVGGGLRVGVEASPCDGMLDVAILPEVELGTVSHVLADWLHRDAALFRHVIYGKFESAKAVFGEEVAVSVDGEASSSRELDFAISPRAVPFLTAPAWTAP